jgi:hypothetical protein
MNPIIAVYSRFCKYIVKTKKDDFLRPEDEKSAAKIW